MIVNRRYVAPATHATNSGGPMQAVPYGARFRLRSDFPVSSLDSGAQVIARALQTYGMILADGGQIALTAESDAFAEHTWEEVGVGDYSLSSIDATDFEIIDTGASVYDSWDCQREQITE
jgi:serine/threonine-protein kinase